MKIYHIYHVSQKEADEHLQGLTYGIGYEGEIKQWFKTLEALRAFIKNQGIPEDQIKKSWYGIQTEKL
jgi:hypothetical protein